jgi:hypothetical protein
MDTVNTDSPQKTAAPSPKIPFTVASRPQDRFASRPTPLSNLTTSTQFQPIQVPPTGFVRALRLTFTVTVAASAGGAVVAGDGPWNLINNITLTDARGLAITQPVSGFNLYLMNKYFSSGARHTNIPRAWGNPHMGPQYQYSATATTGTATFRLFLVLEQDYASGYGCVPNLDANSTLQLKCDVNPITLGFAGTLTAANVAVTVDSDYWAAVGNTVGGIGCETTPLGVGDFLETRYETQTVTAGSENIINLNNKGGMVRGIILVSRAAGVRTAFVPGSNAGLVYDNNAITEGITIEAHQEKVARTYGYLGSEIGSSYAPLSPGVMPGLDRGVHVLNFGADAAGRDTWMPTRVGTLLQAKLTPGAGATSMEVITLLMQAGADGAFYDR